MDSFNEIDLVELSNKRKLDKLLSHISGVHRTSNMNPAKIRWGLIIKEGNGDRVYLIGDTRRKEFNLSHSKEDSIYSKLCEPINEMDFDFIRKYIINYKYK